MLFMIANCEGKKRQLLQKWLARLLCWSTYHLVAATSYLSTLHNGLLSNCLQLPDFFSEQNTEIFCRLVKYVFEFCKNSNVLGFFFCIFFHVLWKSPLHSLPCNPQKNEPHGSQTWLQLHWRGPSFKFCGLLWAEKCPY